MAKNAAKRPKKQKQPSLLNRLPGQTRNAQSPVRTKSAVPGSDQQPPAISRPAIDRRMLFIRLGSDQAKSLDVGNKGALLDQAAWAGLPVPTGLILLDEAWQHALWQGLVRMQGQEVIVTNPVRLYRLLGLPRFSRPVAVRSAFSAEDGAKESLAGFFTSRLFVDAADRDQLVEALAKVWGSALRRPGQFRRDVLIMEMIQPAHAGVAFTEREFEDDLINFTEGTADRLVSGAVEGETLSLPRLHPWETPALQTETVTPPPFASRLQRLLKYVRREFGAADWDIEWADDGQHCWLVQLRPITRPTRRNEAFTVANFKEILPDLPSRFMTTLIASCAPGLFAYYRQFDDSLPQNRPIIEVFQGRPFFNISLLTEMMRAWGLPTRLVTGNIGGEAEREYGLSLSRFFSKTAVLLRVGLAQMRSVSSARQTINLILERTEEPGETLSECVETMRWLFTGLVTEMFSLTSAMSGPLLLLRRFGVLAEHNARQQTIATQMYTDLAPLREMAAKDEEIRAALEMGNLPDDPDFRAAWQAYLARHGHRGVYESDIARPRLHEAPEPLLTSLAHATERRARRPRRTLAGLLTLPLWWQAGRVMRTRELLRYNAILGFDRTRQALLKLAELHVERGRLPSIESLWLLTIDEVRQLDRGWTPDHLFFVERRRDIARLEQYDLPDFFHRFDNLESYRQTGDAAPSSETHLHGISLTDGQVEGQAWVLTEPDTALPPDFEGETTILVARSVDAGWIPTFGRVAGVVVEIGGDLSHGSIILREIGLPAITNVRGATRAIQTGDSLLLQAGQGQVEKLQ